MPTGSVTRRIADGLAGRGFLLLPAVALLVHELRYALAYGEEADAALAAQGHGYVDSLAPWLVLLLGLAVGRFLVRVARAGAGQRRRPGGGAAFGGLWAVTSLCLYAIFVVQELLEGLFSSGHPGGTAAVFAHGGWWAMVAAVGLGGVVAALLRLAEAVVELAARLAPSLSQAQTAARVFRPRALCARPLRPLATAAAGRAPPVL